MPATHVLHILGLSVYRCLAAGIRQRITACERCSVLRTRPRTSREVRGIPTCSSRCEHWHRTPGCSHGSCMPSARRPCASERPLRQSRAGEGGRDGGTGGMSSRSFFFGFVGLAVVGKSVAHPFVPSESYRGSGDLWGTGVGSEGRGCQGSATPRRRGLRGPGCEICNERPCVAVCVYGGREPIEAHLWRVRPEDHPGHMQAVCCPLGLGRRHDRLSAIVRGQAGHMQ